MPIHHLPVSKLCSAFPPNYCEISHFQVGWSLSWSESNGFDNDSKFRYSLGADVKISRFDDTYFKLTLGTETGEDTTF